MSEIISAPFVPQPDVPPWFSADAWQSVRSDSLLARLWAKKGLLEETLYLLSLTFRDAKGKIRWEHSTQEIARGLKAQGVECSTAAVHELRTYHVAPWKVHKAEQLAALCGLSSDKSLATQQAIARSTYVLAIEANDIDSVAKLSDIAHARVVEGDNARRTKVLEQRLELQREEYERRLEEQRIQAATFIDAVLAEAARLEKLRALHSDSTTAGEAVKDRLQKIIQTVWGDQAAAA